MRTALVTGSSRGIGRKIALALAGSVRGVAVHYFTNRDAALEVVGELKTKDIKCEAFQADLTDTDAASEMVRAVQKRFGRIDILINNFGPILVKDWKEVAPEEWEEIFKGNLGSSLACMKAALPGMRERKWGRVVNLGYSRVEQLDAFPTIAPYAVAKAGLLILTRTAAKSEGSYNITVNMVSPGLLEDGVLPQEKKIPCGRLGKFSDVASAVLFLVSDRASYITGTNLVVAGGWRL